MPDRHQETASLIMYDAMIALRMFNPGRYNHFDGRSRLSTGELPTLNSTIGDGLHNVPEIMVADMGEAERGAALHRELSIFMQQIEEMDLPANMPQPWPRLVKRIQDALNQDNLAATGLSG